MVPFALNTNRVPDDEGGKFFKAILRKQDWPQGLWIVSPDGKILAFHYYRGKPGETPAAGHNRWIFETRGFIEEGLKAFGDVKPRKADATDPLKYRGIGKMPNGSVRLAVYAHGMRKGQKDGEPVVDSTLLTAADWSAFVPGELSAGATWTIAPQAVGKLVPVLSPMTDAIFTPQPKDATKAELTAKVERITGGRALIRLTGQLESQHNRDGDPKLPIRASAAIEGLAECDVTSKELKALLLVTHGEYHRSAAPQATAGVIEWRAE
jgi:hypothetical protein